MIEKINNNTIRGLIKDLKKDFLKNYDLVWLLEQTLNPGNWDVYQGENQGFMIKRNNLFWVRPTSGEEMENFYKFMKNHAPFYVHFYDNWVAGFIESKEYKIKKGEGIYYHCHKDMFKGRKRTQATAINLSDITNCKEKWFSPELIDFLRQKQKIIGIIEDKNVLVGWCYIDSLTKGIAEVYRLEIHPMRRRRGNAIDILSKAMDNIFNS